MPENWQDFFSYDSSPYPARVNPPENDFYNNEVFTNVYEPEYFDDSPYSSGLGGGGFPTSFTDTKDVMSQIFRATEEPGNVAVAAYSGLPYLDPSFEIPSAERLAGESLADLAREGYLNPVSMTQGRETGKITNPYALKGIEKIGGTILGEAMDPTNIPGVLVGAGSLVGRGASALDKIFAGMGAVTGLGEGIPQITSAGSNIWEQGLTPENFGQLLEGGIGAGFGGLSAAGLSTDTRVDPYNVPDPKFVERGTLENPLNLASLGQSVSPDFEVLLQELGLSEAPVFAPTQYTPEQQLRMDQIAPQIDDASFFDYIKSHLGNETGVLDFTPREVSPIDVTDTIQVDDPIVESQALVIPKAVTEPIEFDSNNIYTPPKTFETINAPTEVPIKATWPDGMVHYDVIKGFGIEDALNNAKNNWEGANIEVATNDQVSADKAKSNTEVANTTNNPTYGLGQSFIVPEVLSAESIPIEPKQELSNFVKEMKEKYESNWRKKLDEKEKSEFNQLQLEVQKGSIKPEVLSPGVEKYPENQAALDMMVEAGKEQKRVQDEIDRERNTIDITPENQVAPIEQSKQKNLQDAFDNYNKAYNEEQTKVKSPASDKPTNILPPAPPDIKVSHPNEPSAPESTKLNPLGMVERATLPTLRNLSKASPEIGARIKAYDDYHTEVASENIADIRDVTKGVNKGGEQKIIRFLDGEKVSLDAHEKRVASSLRETLDDIAKLADENDVLVGYRQGYFPRKYADRFEWDISPRSFGTKNMPLGSLEKSREGSRLDFRRDFKVLEEYVNEATRRIAESKFLGKDLGKVSGKQFKGDRATVEFVEKAVARVTGRERSSQPQRVADKLRKITALGDLAFAAVYQPAQIAHTASTVGLRRATRAVFATLKNIPEAVSEATRSGALWPNISHEVSKAVGDKGYMHGVPTMDKVMRIHASVAGRLLAQDALKGNSYARRQLKELGLELSDPKLLSKTSRLIADKTQFRTGTLDMPLWSHSPLGKLASQYQSFAYAHAKFLTDAFKHPIKNFGQIVRFGALGLLAGEGVGDLREILKSLFPGKDEEDDLYKRMLVAATGKGDFDSKGWLEKLKAVTRSKRIPISSPGWRTLQNLSMVGGVGIFQNILEKIASGKYENLLGPSVGMASEFGQALHSDVSKSIKESSPTLRKTGRFALSNLPIPFVSGRKVADYLLPEESSRYGKYR